MGTKEACAGDGSWREDGSRWITVSSCEICRGLAIGFGGRAGRGAVLMGGERRWRKRREAR